MYAVRVPGHTKHDLARTVHKVVALPPHEALDEVRDHPELVEELDAMTLCREWARNYEDHRMVRGVVGPKPFTIAISLGGVPCFWLEARVSLHSQAVLVSLRVRGVLFHLRDHGLAHVVLYGHDARAPPRGKAPRKALVNARLGARHACWDATPTSPRRLPHQGRLGRVRRNAGLPIVGRRHSALLQVQRLR